MEGLVPGRIVHYVLRDGDRNAGEHRPAIVIRVWEDEAGETGCCQLGVFRDGSNDTPTGELVEWRTSVLFSAEAAPGTWHWIEGSFQRQAREAAALVGGLLNQPNPAPAASCSPGTS